MYLGTLDECLITVSKEIYVSWLEIRPGYISHGLLASDNRSASNDLSAAGPLMGLIHSRLMFAFDFLS